MKGGQLRCKTGENYLYTHRARGIDRSMQVFMLFFSFILRMDVKRLVCERLRLKRRRRRTEHKVYLKLYSCVQQLPAVSFVLFFYFEAGLKLEGIKFENVVFPWVFGYLLHPFLPSTSPLYIHGRKKLHIYLSFFYFSYLVVHTRYCRVSRKHQPSREIFKTSFGTSSSTFILEFLILVQVKNQIKKTLGIFVFLTAKHNELPYHFKICKQLIHFLQLLFLFELPSLTIIIAFLTHDIRTIYSLFNMARFQNQ